MIGAQAVPHRGSRWALALAIVAGLAAALVSYLALKGAARSSDAPAIQGKPVVIAAQNIPARTRITLEMVKVETVPSHLLTEGALSDIQRAVGRVARYPIASGEQITQAKLAEASTGREISTHELASIVPPGKRAVAINVDEATMVGGLVLPGDFVDVIGVFEVDRDNHIYASLVIAENVQVLAVAQNVSQLPADASQLPPQERVRIGQAEPQPKAKTVTLALDPPQVLAVSLASKKGTIYLALRGFSDMNPTFVAPLTGGARLPPDLEAIASLLSRR